MDWFMSFGPNEDVPHTKRFAPCFRAIGAVFT